MSLLYTDTLPHMCQFNKILSLELVVHVDRFLCVKLKNRIELQALSVLFYLRRKLSITNRRQESAFRFLCTLASLKLNFYSVNGDS